MRGIALAVAVFALAHGAGYALLAPAEAEGDYGVGMYQSNYSQHMKWDPDFQQEMLQKGKRYAF